MDRAGSKDRFRASVSHELRSPLNSVTGLSRLLMEPGGGLSDEQLYQVGLIKDSSEVLLTLVTGLDAPARPRAAALLRKDQLSWERLAFATRRAGLAR